MSMRKIKYILIIAFCIPIFSWAQGNKLVNTINDKIINEIRTQLGIDSRQAVWSAFAYETPKGIVVKGKCSDSKIHDLFKLKMQQAGMQYSDSIYNYPTDEWGIVRISVAHLRGGNSHSAEIVSQAIMGTPLRLLEKDGEWWKVQSPDGYISFIIGNSIVKKELSEIKKWRKSDRLVVTSLDQIKAYDSPDASSSRNIVTDLVNGCIVEGRIDQNVNRVNITLPDGRKCWADSEHFTPINEWANQKFNPVKIMDIAYSMMGIPYLWGGMSTKSLDCSGFARVCYFANGIILMRDASQQALTGTRIEADQWRSCETGDLLFFGNAKTKRVTHVAIYEENGGYVHSSGRVKYNSVDPKSSDYLTTPFLHCVRINGNEGSKGITRVSEHPWYFNVNNNFKF